MSDPVARKAARAELATRLFVVFVGSALVVCIALGTALLVKFAPVIATIRQTQVTNTSVNSTNTQLLQLIHSCLTPGQPCYVQGQEQRATTAADSQRVIVAAASCASTLSDPTYNTVYHCVVTTLAGKGKP